ncbi:phytanoyl-CoA dioxygenase family protein [Hymenobacter edaphi]|uniref:Phytanoyl-CoA dioxygenase n=1 Tax=Hymenobacter edaphi TaxID=2211146 RepID=A0A328BM05_9BACT|nr:phytanoyl-CoA dioxygenase family protein [Hymenobacter edaphi]RAK67997.1 phytanoyl-CoA dioxygenase [Hymenobacter edaphi]
MSLSADYPRFTLAAGLTPAQVAFFRQHGFLHFRGFAGPAEVGALRAALAELQARWLREGVRQVNGIPLKFGRDAAGRPLIQRLAFAAQHSPALARWLQDARLPALFALLDAPDVRLGVDEKNGLVVGQYRHAPGSRFSQMGWHTDALRDVFDGRRPAAMLNVGLHLDACPAAHGGLRLLPGTHRQGLAGLLWRKRYFLDTSPDPAELALETEAGDLTVHDGRLWHRVARAATPGEASLRRVLYVPILGGPRQPRHAGSATPLYLRFLDWLR